jgi:hypothetical protein
MRKNLGKLGETIAGLLRYAIPLFLLISVDLCYAQCPGATTPPTSPTTWYAGQDNNFNFPGTTVESTCSAPGVACEAFGDLAKPDGKEIPFSYCITPDLVSGTVTLPADTPTENAAFTLQISCDPDVNQPCPNNAAAYTIWQGSINVQIIACGVPKITSALVDGYPTWTRTSQ